MSQDMINNRFLEESVFAIADGYCVINLTKNIVRGSMYQVINGKKYNLNEQLGLPENSRTCLMVCISSIIRLSRLQSISG